MLDFIIVGAGPSGLSSAIEIAKSDLEVLLIEEDKRVGLPRHCTGIISNEAAKLIGYPAFMSTINKVKKADIIYGDKKISLGFSEEVTCILERVKFEEYLLKEALNKGAEIKFGERVRRIRNEGSKVLVDTNNSSYEARALIYAAGSKPPIIQYESPYSIPAIQYEIEGDVEDEEKVEIIFTEEAKGFFAWKAPISKDAFLIGLANENYSPKIMLDKLIEKKKIKGKMNAIYSGRIVKSKAMAKNYFKNIAFVGDSAGHVKPTTGGGLFYGILGSRITAILFSKYILTKDERYLKELEKLNNNLIAKRINRMKLFSDLFFKIDMKMLSYMLDSIAYSKSLKKMNSNIQDYHEKVISLFLSDLSIPFKFASIIFKDKLDRFIKKA